jgi:hypothetical protein
MDKLRIHVKRGGLEIVDDRIMNSGFSITLSPKEAFEFIKTIQRALFDWRDLTGEKIDSPACS